jgi:hypothetical protein
LFTNPHHLEMSVDDFEEIAPQITNADFSHQQLGLGRLPEEIGLMKNLASLNLANVGFAFFPSSICELTHLKTFDITENNAGFFANYSDPHQLPQCFSVWKELEIFNASQSDRGMFLGEQNFIRTYDAPNVKVFNASHTKEYLSVPISISLMVQKWTKLEILDLSGTGWKSGTAVLNLNQNWSSPIYCPSVSDGAWCAEVPTSWTNSSSLTAIYLSDLFL